MENEDKGTSLYCPSIEARNALRILADYHGRSMGKELEKLILDEWYLLSPEVRGELVSGKKEYHGEETG